MGFSRNTYYCVGLVLLLLGLEFRLVDTATLNPEATAFLAKQAKHPVAAVNAAVQAVNPEAKPIGKKTVKPPDWIGYALLCAGAVFVFHALGMPKQG
jgi:hypothetical protein